MNKQNIIIIVVLVVSVVGFYILDNFITGKKENEEVGIVTELSYVDVKVSGGVVRSGSYYLPSELTINDLFEITPNKYPLCFKFSNTS